MIDIVFGSKDRGGPTHDLVATIEPLNAIGTLYLGYPVMLVQEQNVEVDALLTSDRHGIVAIDLKSYGSDINNDEVFEEIGERQSTIYAALYSKFLEDGSLRSGRALEIDIQVVSIHQSDSRRDERSLTEVVAEGSLADFLGQREAIEEITFQKLNAVVQRTASLRPRKRRQDVVRNNSRGFLLKTIEREIANLDAHQKKAAIEVPDGPQRIRGLAGSGKTIVLAQKAAHLHTKYPDWKIAVTFQTRSLYQQFKELIRRFTFEAIKDEPNWDNLRVMHAWGGAASSGVYSEIADMNGKPYVDFGAAKQRYGASGAFNGVCAELLASIGNAPEEHFDAVLIDEAQDLPQPFFELVWLSTKKPKRIVYAYDELQNLSDLQMFPAEQLFGSGGNNHPRVTLRNQPGEPKQDIILPVCYRNSPWSLSVAHSLGFGIYRPDGLVQMFENASLWSDIGYENLDGEIQPGADVRIQRKRSASPGYFIDLIQPSDAVAFHEFADSSAEFDWVVDDVLYQIQNEEIDYDDVLIITSNPINIRKDAARLIRKFAERDVESHLVGVTSSTDSVFQKNSIAITSIYRAKGNEAPLVYFVGAEYCASGFGLARKRNILFTAMTRSRAWVRISGCGADMSALMQEVERAVEVDYRLEFKYPTQAELQTIHRLNREMTREELSRAEGDIEALSRVIEKLQNGEMPVSALPPGLRDVAKNFLS